MNVTGHAADAVLFVAHSYPHGLVLHLAQQAVALHAACETRGIEFHVAAVAREWNPGAWDLLRGQLPGARLHVCGGFEEGLRDVARGLLGTHPRVLLHSGGGRRQMAALVPVRRSAHPRLRLVVTTHYFGGGSWRRMPVSWVLGRAYRRHADHVIFPCPYAARRFIGGFGLFRSGRASIVPLGARPVPACSEGATSCGDPDIRPLLAEPGFFNVVYLAEFRRGKQQAWLVETAASVLRARPQVRLFLLGGGEKLERVRRRIAELALGSQVFAAGRVDHARVPGILAQCHCGVVASRDETFGHGYVEPMMAGLPVVGSRVGAGEYLLQDYLTGIGFAPGDGAACATALAYLADHAGEAAQMGRRARDLASQCCSFRDIANAHARLYHQILTEGDRVSSGEAGA